MGRNLQATVGMAIQSTSKGLIFISFKTIAKCCGSDDFVSQVLIAKLVAEMHWGVEEKGDNLTSSWWPGFLGLFLLGTVSKFQIWPWVKKNSLGTRDHRFYWPNSFFCTFLTHSRMIFREFVDIVTFTIQRGKEIGLLFTVLLRPVEFLRQVAGERFAGWRYTQWRPVSWFFERGRFAAGFDRLLGAFKHQLATVETKRCLPCKSGCS